MALDADAVVRRLLSEKAAAVSVTPGEPLIFVDGERRYAPDDRREPLTAEDAERFVYFFLPDSDRLELRAKGVFTSEFGVREDGRPVRLRLKALDVDGRISATLEKL
jgi:hypothetical protein